MAKSNKSEKPAKAGKQPNILVIWGDDIGISNLSATRTGLMGYQTPNIDRIAKEGMMFTDTYGEQSCTAGRSSFITGQSVLRTGLSKVGIPAAPIGMNDKIVTIAALLKKQGYATGQFGKNHLGDLNSMLPTNHGFDEFFGNLYHLNAEEEPEMVRLSIRRRTFRTSGRLSGRAASSTRGRRTRTTRPSSRAGARSASRRSRTPARSPRSGWRPATTSSSPRRPTSSSGRTRPASRGSSGSTPRTCTCSRTRRRKSLGQAGRWQSPYHDTMIDHDKNVGQMLDLLDELGHRGRHVRACTRPTTARTAIRGPTAA